MNILFVTENFPPERNASASRVYERACYWVRWGHHVTVVTCAPNFPEGKVYEGYENRWYQVDRVSGIRVVRVKTFVAKNEGRVRRSLDFLSFMVSGFVAGLFQQRPHVVVATSPQFFAAVGGWALARARGVPFVFELSDLWPASISAVGAIRNDTILRLLERLELFLYRQSATIVALSPAFKEDLVKRGIESAKVSVVLNGVDLPRFEPRPPAPHLMRQLGLEGCFVIGYLGTHGMAHALHRVLDAADLLQDLAEVRFLFVGVGADRHSLEVEASRRGLRNVLFVPGQPKERMPEYWSVCDLALVHLKDSPVFAGVIPSKIFEAMAMACPILLAAPEGEATAIIRQTGCGLVVSPENPAELAAAIRSLCSNREKVAALARAARAAAPLYSRERQASEMMGLLNRLVPTNPGVAEIRSIP